jgi:hypothetical protein
VSLVPKVLKSLANFCNASVIRVIRLQKSGRNKAIVVTGGDALVTGAFLTRGLSSRSCTISNRVRLASSSAFSMSSRTKRARIAAISRSRSILAPLPLRPGLSIACINYASVDLGAPIDKLTATLQKCFNECFRPIWGYPVKLYTTDAPGKSDWRLIFVDDANIARREFGLHERTNEGQPVAKVFVNTVRKAKQLVSVAACHELFEMVIDPLVNLWAEASDGTEYAYEVADPVEEDTFPVDGIAMSNFVYPSWFEPFDHPPGTKFDYLDRLKKPFSITRGGYVIKRINGRVTHAYGSKAKEKRFAKEDRRNHRSEFRKQGGLV